VRQKVFLLQTESPAAEKIIDSIFDAVSPCGSQGGEMTKTSWQNCFDLCADFARKQRRRAAASRWPMFPFLFVT